MDARELDGGGMHRLFEAEMAAEGKGGPPQTLTPIRIHLRLSFITYPPHSWVFWPTAPERSRPFLASALFKRL